MMRLLIMCQCLLFILGCKSTQPNETTASTLPFTFKTFRSDDTITARSQEQAVIFDVHSPFGISSATIRRKSESWSERVLIRLHLTMLDEFVVNNGAVELGAAIVNAGNYPTVRSLTMADDTITNRPPPKEGDPYFMPVRIFDQRPVQDARLPINEGYIELELPRALFKDNPKEIHLRWIDFYR